MIPFLIFISVVGWLFYYCYREIKKERKYDEEVRLIRETLDKIHNTKKARIMFKLSDMRGNRYTKQYSHYTYDKNMMRFPSTWTPNVKVVSAKEVAAGEILRSKDFITDDQGIVYPMCNVLEMWVIEDEGKLDG